MFIGSPFTDTHVHFHDFSHPGLRWNWLTADAVDPELGNYDAIKARRYTAEDFLAETRFRDVLGTWCTCRRRLDLRIRWPRRSGCRNLPTGAERRTG